MSRLLSDSTTAGPEKREETAAKKPRGSRAGLLTSPEPLDQDVALNVFLGSAGMIGVCLTCIGLLRIFSKLGHVDTLSDDLVAVDAFLFLAACIVSYVALRNRSTHRRHGAERLADGLFISGLVLMALICAIVVWTFL